MTCSGVPTSPARSPRLDTLYSSSETSDSSCDPVTKSWYDAYAAGGDRTSRMRASSACASSSVSRTMTKPETPKRSGGLPAPPGAR